MPVVILPLAFFLLAASFKLNASPTSYLWGHNTKSNLTNFQQAGIYYQSSNELWEESDNKKSGGYEHSTLLVLPNWAYKQLDAQLTLGQQTYLYEIDHRQSNNDYWSTSSRNTVFNLEAHLNLFRLKIEKLTNTKYWNIQLHLTEQFSIFYQEEEENFEYTLNDQLTGENDDLIFIELPHIIDNTWYKNGFNYHDDQLNLSIAAHFPDDEFKDKKWIAINLNVKHNDKTYSIDYELSEYNFLNQSILIDGATEGYSTGYQQLNNLKLSINNKDINYQLHIREQAFELFGLYDAQALSAHFLNPFLGPGRYDIEAELQSATFLATFDPQFKTKPWNYSLGLGYLELEGIVEQIIFANPFGVFEHKTEEINLKSATWGIFHLAYQWSHKNWHIQYQWQQIIPFDVQNRRKNNNSNISNSKKSDYLKWPLTGSKHLLNINYYFD